MIPQYSDTEYARSCIEAGKDSQIYKEKVEWLKKKWPETSTANDETTGMRLVGPLIQPSVAPLDIALVSDNLDAFKQHYKIYLSNINPATLLDQACLCGSQAIAEFLLTELKLTYLKSPERILPYVAASPNVPWITELAKHLASAGRKLPPLLSVFASQEIEARVKTIFSENSQPLKLS